MQHKQNPIPGSWASRPPGEGGKGVGGGPPVERSNENYEYEVDQPVNEMTLPDSLFQTRVGTRTYE